MPRCKEQLVLLVWNHIHQVSSTDGGSHLVLNDVTVQHLLQCAWLIAPRLHILHRNEWNKRGFFNRRDLEPDQGHIAVLQERKIEQLVTGWVPHYCGETMTLNIIVCISKKLLQSFGACQPKDLASKSRISCFHSSALMESLL